MKKILLLTLLGFVLRCRTEDAVATAAIGQTCRAYMQKVTDTTNSITYNCTYNGSTTLSCTNGGSETMTFTYPNLQSFVNEAVIPVSVFNLTKATSVVFGSAVVARQSTLTLTYNNTGQWSGATSTSGSGISAVSTYINWDLNNRPTAGTSSFTAGATCTGRNLAITNTDGATRTRTTVGSGGVGANCATMQEAQITRDADNHIITGFGRDFIISTTGTQCY